MSSCYSFERLWSWSMRDQDSGCSVGQSRLLQPHWRQGWRQKHPHGVYDHWCSQRGANAYLVLDDFILFLGPWIIWNPTFIESHIPCCLVASITAVLQQTSKLSWPILVWLSGAGNQGLRGADTEGWPKRWTYPKNCCLKMFELSISWCLKYVCAYHIWIWEFQNGSKNPNSLHHIAFPLQNERDIETIKLWMALDV